jgi:hypothetical protein
VKWSLVAGVLLASALARAEPTTKECLAASEAWIGSREAHHLRDARAQLLVCAAPSCPHDVREECARHVPEINEAVPTVVFEAKTTMGKDVADVTVTVDGTPFATKLDGTALEIEPGEHKVRAEGAGLPPVEQTIVIREGDKDRHERITLHVPGEPLATEHSARPLVVVRARSHGTQRIAGIVIGSLGLAGIAAGSVVGVVAMSDWNQVKADCPIANQCATPDAYKLHDATVTLGWVSTAAFIFGGAALVAGVVILATTPRDASVTVGLRVGLGALVLDGRF